MSVKHIVLTIAALGLVSSAWGQKVLFRESFDDSLTDNRGWYDGRFVITSAQHVGGQGCAEFRFRQGARTGEGGGGIRHLFTSTDTVWMRCFVKHSANWVGSQKPYHPHEFHLVTSEDNTYVGPARTHLTTYTEENGGRVLVGIQDGSNIDETKIGVDLTTVTENRAVAGCNGDAPGQGTGDCYPVGSLHYNGRTWKDGGILFSDSPGQHDKAEWHKVESLFMLNTISGGKGVADGVIQYWYDDSLIIDQHNVLLRTGAHPTMHFNQFLMAPYIGDGSPVDQTLWVDELELATGRKEIPVTGVDADRKLPGSSTLELYPNPASNEVQVFNALGDAGIEIVDVFGRVVRSVGRGSWRTVRMIPLDGLPSGMYVVRAVNGGNRTGSVLHVVR